MPFRVKKPPQINVSSLDKLGDSTVDLAKYVDDEFAEVASAFQNPDPFQILNVAPPKPRTGLLSYADGNNWNPGYGEGLYVFNLGGLWVPLSGRPQLRADRTYFVDAASGNDANTGLSSGSGAFKTIGKALTITGGIDTGVFQLTISVAAGTYAEVLNLPRVVGSLVPILIGAGSTSIIQPSITLTYGVTNDNGGSWIVQNFKIAQSGVASGIGAIKAVNFGVIKLKGIEFGTVTDMHLYADTYGSIEIIGNYTITGGAVCHLITNYGKLTATGALGYTVTITGTPTFSFSFALSNRIGFIRLVSTWVAWSGGVTGQRYQVINNSLIDTAGSGANYFPGSIAGATGSGGIYI